MKKTNIEKYNEEFQKQGTFEKYRALLHQAVDKAVDTTGMAAVGCTPSYDDFEDQISITISITLPRSDLAFLKGEVEPVFDQLKAEWKAAQKKYKFPDGNSGKSDPAKALARLLAGLG